jgi:hypothetical protein
MQPRYHNTVKTEKYKLNEKPRNPAIPPPREGSPRNIRVTQLRESHSEIMGPMRTTPRSTQHQSSRSIIEEQRKSGLLS